MTKPNFRVGIIGADTAASWAGASHVPALAAQPNLELTAVATRREESARAAAEAFGAERWYADPYALIADETIDIVTVSVKVGVSRDDVVIATKGFSAMGEGPNRRGASRRHLISACRASLQRLGLDHIDLYQVHGFDAFTPIEETVEALDTLVRAGDVRYVGLSNWAAWQIMKAIGISQARGLAPVTSLQAYYTLVGRDLEREIVPMLTAERVGLMVWSPLAGGYLTGKYANGGDATGGRQTELDFPPIDRSRGEPLIETLTGVAAKHERPQAQIAIAWLLHQPVVSTVIVGAKRVEQLQDNVRSTEVKLDAEDLAALDKVSRLPSEYPGWLLNPSKWPSQG